MHREVQPIVRKSRESSFSVLPEDVAAPIYQHDPVITASFGTTLLRASESTTSSYQCNVSHSLGLLRTHYGVRSWDGGPISELPHNLMACGIDLNDAVVGLI